MANEVMISEEPLTAQDIRNHVNRVQEVMKAVMIDGQHYGLIPGCGPKPTLLKPGAEKLMETFRLAVDPQIDDLSTALTRRYRIVARVTAQSTGRFLGAGVGECSSDEEKYAWREAVCKEEWEETDPMDRRNKWKRGTKEPFVVHQIKTNAPDIANTILKMAKKRALVDAILTVTAASDIFTQDIEDLPEDVASKPVGQATKARQEDAAGESRERGTSAPQQASETPALTDSAWFDQCLDWQEHRNAAFLECKKKLHVESAKDLTAEGRVHFRNTMADLERPKTKKPIAHDPSQRIA